MCEKSCVLGSNKSVADSSMMTQNRLHKRHEALHFHCARESIVTVIASYIFIEGALNPASALNTH